MVIDKQKIEKLALQVIYDVDYDIGKESDPEVMGEDDYLIQEVASTIVRFLAAEGIEVE